MSERRGANWTPPSDQSQRCFLARIDVAGATETCANCLRDISRHFGGTQYRCDEVPEGHPDYQYGRRVIDEHVDIINHPPHYTRGGIEAIDVIEAWGLGFCLGNTVKYIARAGHKGDALDDLRKARWYLEREIARREREAKGR